MVINKEIWLICLIDDQIRRKMGHLTTGPLLVTLFWRPLNLLLQQIDWKIVATKTIRILKKKTRT